MRYYLLVIASLLTALNGWAQPAQAPRRDKPVFYSASSDWQKIYLPATAAGARPAPPAVASATPPVAAPTPSATTRNPAPTRTAEAERQSASRPPTASPTTVTPLPRPTRPSDPTYRPAFTADFATNRNGWKSGNHGDYNYQLGLGRYNIRKRNVNTTQVAFSHVLLPSDINLNIAETFTIRVDMLTDSGRIPTGGLLFGVLDSLNYSAFTLTGKGDITIVRVVNGETFGDYMPGDAFRPGVALDKNRDRLTIRRRYDALHFYINEQEVRGSPYPFRPFSGNGIGLLTSAYWTSFQKMGVTLGL